MNSNARSLIKIYETEIVKIENIIQSSYTNKFPKSLYIPYSYPLIHKGKLLRPLLVLLSAKVVGGSYSQVRNAAAAVEFAHISSLVHDDVMDKSSVRRGVKTLHTAYNIDTSIIVGDTLIFNAYKYLLQDSSKNTKEILTIFTKAAVEMCEGQSLDMEFEKREDVSVKEYLEMVYKKTAVLLETACLLGAYIAGGDKVHIDAVSKFGKFLGMAFQIQDDLLDISAEDKQFGKEIGLDFLNNKKTYIYLRFLERASISDIENCKAKANTKAAKNKALQAFKESCIRLGVLHDAELEIAKYAKRALKSLESLPENEGKQLLISLLGEILVTKY